MCIARTYVKTWIYALYTLYNFPWSLVKVLYDTLYLVTVWYPFQHIHGVKVIQGRGVRGASVTGSGVRNGITNGINHI